MIKYRCLVASSLVSFFGVGSVFAQKSLPAEDGVVPDVIPENKQTNAVIKESEKDASKAETQAANKDATKDFSKENAALATSAPHAWSGHVALHGVVGLGGGKGKLSDDKKDKASARFGLRYSSENVEEQNSSLVFGLNYGSHTGVHKKFDTNHAIQQFVATSGFWFRPSQDTKEFSVQVSGGLGMWRKTGRYQDAVKATKVDSGPLFELEVDSFYEVLPKVQIVGGVATNLSKESWFQGLVGLQANL